MTVNYCLQLFTSVVLAMSTRRPLRSKLEYPTMKRPYPSRRLEVLRRQMIARNQGWRVPRRWTVNQRTSGFRGSAGDAKYVDLAFASYALDTTGSITHMDIVAQNSTVNGREGKAFRDVSILLRGYAANGPTAIKNDCAVLLVWDKQPNKALAAITDVLDTTSSYSMNKRENASRFVVIRRWDWGMTGKGDGSTVGGYYRNFDHYVKLPPDCVATCTVADNTGVIGNRVSGALLLVTVGSNAAGDTAAAISLGARINFEDV